MKRLLRGALAGALFGLLLFALEGALMLGDGVIGLDLHTQGPFAALFAAVKPFLPGLLARVLTAYLLGGAALGLGAALLSVLVLPADASRWRWAALLGLEWG